MCPIPTLDHWLWFLANPSGPQIPAQLPSWAPFTKTTVRKRKLDLNFGLTGFVWALKRPGNTTEKGKGWTWINTKHTWGKSQHREPAHPLLPLRPVLIHRRFIQRFQGCSAKWATVCVLQSYGQLGSFTLDFLGLHPQQIILLWALFSEEPMLKQREW